MLSLGTRHDHSYRLFHRNLMIAHAKGDELREGLSLAQFDP
jgi:hypothetical protein